MVRAYQVTLSPWLGRQCRYHPTCSTYAIEALAEHGAISGAALAARRLARCHPFARGGYDPVPIREGHNPRVGHCQSPVTTRR